MGITVVVFVRGIVVVSVVVEVVNMSDVVVLVSVEPFVGGGDGASDVVVVVFLT